MLALLLATTFAVQVPDSARVVLVATTDVHGHAIAWDYVTRRPFPGSLARVAPVVDSLRRRYPGQVIVLDAGDLLQGDPFATYFARVATGEPHPVIEAMNLVGYDVVTPGNHDFDWGVPTFRRAVRDAAFPYVSANIYAAAADSLLFPSHRVLRRQGVRVGITGFTTPGVMLWDRDQLRGQVRVARIEETAGRALEALRREADLAVAVIHSGMDGPASYDTTDIGDENVAAKLAELPGRPDVVIVGHTHREMRDSVLNGVHFVQPRPYGLSVSVVHVHLLRRDGRWRVSRVRADLVPTQDVAPSPLLTERLAVRHDSVKAWMDQPVGEALAPMPATAARAQPTAVTDFVLEAQRRRTGADLSSGPAFNLSVGFDSGTIRRSDVLGLYPYENTLRAVRITGARLKAYLEWSARYFRVDPVGRVSLNDSVPGYDFDLVRGARYDIDLRQPAGDRIRNLAVRGRLVQPADSFTMAINSYRQTGGGGYDMLRGATVVYDRGERVSDVLVEEVTARSPLDPNALPPSEWRIVPAVAASAVRTIFGVPPDPGPSAARDTILLRVIGTSDLHGAMLTGAAAIGTMMDSLAAACDCPTLRLDGGDAMQGDLLANVTDGRAAVSVLNRLGYAAASLGDRDFNWPLDTLRRRMGESSYPWLVANLFDSSTGRRPAWAVPYRLLQAAGMSVAVVGYVTPTTKAALPPDRTRRLRFGEGELAIHDVLGEVNARRPALTILLAHAGAVCDSVICDGEVVRLAEQLGGSGVDLVLAGHEHRPVNTRVGGIPIVGAGGAGSLAVADLVKTPAGGRELRARVERVDSGAVRPEPALAAAIETYRRRSDTLMHRVLGRMKHPLVRSGDQFPLGGFLAEARRNLGRADIGLVRTEAIRADLPAGPVTFARLTEVEPFRSDLVRLTLTGTQLRAVLEQALPGPGVPVAHIAGALVRYDPKSQAGHRIKNVVLHGGRQVVPRELYTVATDDSTANGAGGFTMLAGHPYEWRGMLEVEATAAFLRRLPQPVEAEAPTGFLSTRR